jgi:hypothetical protein
MPKRNPIRKRKAWLVTWEWSGDHAKVAEKVVAIFNPRIGGERIRELVELLYIQSGASLAEKLSWAVDRADNPYPAKFGSLNGVPWQGEIECGHNPWLFARLVDDLWVEAGEDGKEGARWKERPKPDLRWMNKIARN